MIFKLVNFIIFAGVLVYFLKKPAGEFWSLRHFSIGAAIDAAKRANDAALAEGNKWNARMAGADAEERSLIEDLKKEGKLEQRKMVEDARKYAERLKRDAARLIEQATQHAVAELKKFIINKAIDAATRRLASETSKSDHEMIIRKACGDIEATFR